MFEDVFGLVHQLMNVDDLGDVNAVLGHEIHHDYTATDLLDPSPLHPMVASMDGDAGYVSHAPDSHTDFTESPHQVDTGENTTTGHAGSHWLPEGLGQGSDHLADSFGTSSYLASPHVIGDPFVDAYDWHLQEAPNSCAVACQVDVLNSFGLHVSEHDIAELAWDRGWYDPRAGTDPHSLGYVLEEFGIPVTQTYDTSLTTLFDALEHGRKVIVGLNANEIWEPQRDAFGMPLQQPVSGHVVWVTGIEDDSGGNLDVIINDTGQVNGRAFHVAMDDFLNAWDDFGRQAAITDVRPGGSHVA